MTSWPGILCDILMAWGRNMGIIIDRLKIACDGTIWGRLPVPWLRIADR
jgi:hypothetical protein